ASGQPRHAHRGRFQIWRGGREGIGRYCGYLAPACAFHGHRASGWRALARHGAASAAHAEKLEISGLQRKRRARSVRGTKDMKRFYKEVSVAPADRGFTVLLDGKPVKTPSRATLA